VSVSIDDVRAVTLSLPRSTEGVEREGIMGFAHPREWREAAIEAEPDKFVMPVGVDLKYRWLYVRMDAIEPAEMRELVTDAWSMVVPRKVLDAYLASRTDEPGR
jgi:hypothetical protein